MKRTVRGVLCIMLMGWVCSMAQAQEHGAGGVDGESGAGTVSPGGERSSSSSQTALAGQLFAKSGWVGLAIAVVAFVMLTLAIYDFIAIRRKVYLPPVVLARMSELSAKLDYEGILRVCREDSSLISRVVSAGLANRRGGYEQMVESMEEVGRGEATRLYQNVGYLSLIGNVAPMMGLLGTVTGMMRSFYAVAEYAGNVQPGRLAEGIYEALTTTFMGLLVAIPALILFVFFRNRIVNVLDETAAVAEEIIFPLKDPKVLASLPAFTLETGKEDATRAGGPAGRGNEPAAGAGADTRK